MANFSLNWPAGRVPRFELATSAAASYFSRYASMDLRRIAAAFVVGATAVMICACSSRSPIYAMRGEVCDLHRYHDIAEVGSCSRAIEARLLQESPVDIHRDGPELNLLAASSARTVFRDAEDPTDAQVLSYSYIGTLPSVGQHVIEVQHYEGVSYLMVDAATGAQTESSGVPVASPSGSRIVSTSVDVCAGVSTELEIWRVVGGRLEKELLRELSSEDWRPGEPRWRSDTEIRFPKLGIADDIPHGEGRLLLTPQGWKGDGI